jgi:predicted nucleotidyltransferase
MSINSIPPHIDIEDGLEERFCKAWNMALEIARMLKEKYHAEDVRILGSLLSRERFHEDSDIDIAVTNFTEAQAFDIEPEFEKYFPVKVDLIPLNSVYPEKRAYILSRSEPLGP